MWLLIILGIVLVAVLCIALVVLTGGALVVLTGGSSTATAAAQSTPPRTDSPRLGQTVDEHGYTVSVWRVDDPATPARLYSPQTGMRLVGVDVTVENDAPSGQLFVDALRFRLIDTSGAVYDESLGSAAGEIRNTHLNPGESRTGIAGFVLPNGAQVATLRFFLREPRLFDGPYITVDLSP